MQGLMLRDVQSVLCLGAHADDIEIGCGGTLLQLVEANPQLHVSWIVFSANERRHDEALDSAKRFLGGAASRGIEIFDYRDSYFPDQWSQIKERIAGLAQSLSPDLTFTHRLDDRHQDHRVIAELTWCAFRNHFVLEYEIPKFEGDLGQPNFYSPLARRECDEKITNLVECFPSQADKQWFDPELFRGLMRLRGSECHAPNGYAEAFHCRKATFSTA
jgi:LmbE family N-acetylglucosaminyl deacetylase